MEDLLSGLVVAVTQIPVGTQTAAAASSGESVLLLDDTVDMAPSGGQATINGVVTDYAFSDDDESTITLATPLAAALDEGAAVMVYPPKVETTALVLIDGASDPIPATIPWHLQDALPVGVREEEDREQVRLTRDGEWSWAVHDLPGEPLARDAVSTYMPRLWAAKGGDDPLPNGEWVALGGFFVLRSDRVSADPWGRRFTVLVDGEYDIRVGVTFSAASGGNRAVRLHYYSADGFDMGASRQVKYPGDGVATIETAQLRGMKAGESVEFEVWQNSGVTVDVRGSNVFEAPPFTDCAIRRAGPL